MLDLIEAYLGFETRLYDIAKEQHAPVSGHKPRAVLDIECYRGFFLVVIMRVSDGAVLTFELSDRCALDREKLRRVLRRHTIITFNGQTYDAPMTFLALTGATTEELKEASDRIIVGGIKWWHVEQELGIKIPDWFDHVDMFEPNPGVRVSLKTLNGRLHGKAMQDLPYPPDHRPNNDERDRLTAYCVNDCHATALLLKTMEEPLALREKVSAELGIDVRSKSDTQMGTAIIKHRIEKLSGKRICRTDFKPGITFKYEAPDFIRFENPVLRDILTRIRGHTFITGHDGKVDLPKWLASQPITIGNSTYQMGIGGLHSTEANRAVRSDEGHVLCDFDVTSYYPSIILALGLYPKAVGKDFLTVYSKIKDDRVRAKQAGDKVMDQTYKISLNGTFGVLGSRFSFLYGPHLLVAVTLTGQLSLLMFIERAERLGISVVSANTDGAVLRVPRSMWTGMKGVRPNPSPLADIVETWERDTGFGLEGTEYTALYNQSVNTYFAIKPDGKAKRKGKLSNPWKDGDLRGQMMRNPEMTICSDAALERILNGTPTADTIRNCKDIRGFVTVVKATGGGTWRDGYLGKVVRYYWSTDGDAIVKVKPHASTGNRPKVPKTEGCRPIMTLPDELPDDIDFSRYEAEAETILRDIGFYGKPSIEDLL